jgi:hypothetical protein
MAMKASHLRSAIERLAAIDRSSCSGGEHEAAEWIVAELRQLGADAVVEKERIHGTYWWPLGITSALGIGAAALTRRGRRLLPAALAGAAAGAVVDELSAGPRVLRRLLPKQLTANVMALAGDVGAEQAVLLVAHHDAAHTSIFFDPRVPAFIARHLPTSGGPATPPPVMAPIAVAPALVAVGALTRSRQLVRAGALICAGIIASMVEIGLRPTVPGANDNLTGVATLLGVARALNARPVSGLRVLLVSTGAEESLMEGMRAFAARHFPGLEAAQARVLCVDSVGSPRLVLAEAEGMLWMRDYDSEFNRLVSDCARLAGVELERGVQMRFGTDGLIALRAGFPAAMLTSVDQYGMPANYHWPTDTPENVEYASLEDAVRLCETVLRRLAGEPQTERARLATSPSADDGASLKTLRGSS